MSRPALICNRLYGGSVRDCGCRLPDDGGWLECPPEARGVLVPAKQHHSAPVLSGDICADCGSPNMARAGTCMLCLDCGSTSGGCS